MEKRIINYDIEIVGSGGILPSSPPQTAEAAAKEIISLIRKGSYEEWVQVISEKLTEYSEIKSLEARNKALQEVKHILQTGRGVDIHWKSWFNSELENLKKTV